VPLQLTDPYVPSVHLSIERGSSSGSVSFASTFVLPAVPSAVLSASSWATGGLFEPPSEGDLRLDADHERGGHGKNGNASEEGDGEHVSEVARPRACGTFRYRRASP